MLRGSDKDRKRPPANVTNHHRIKPLAKELLSIEVLDNVLGLLRGQGTGDVLEGILKLQNETHTFELSNSTNPNPVDRRKDRAKCSTTSKPTCHDTAVNDAAITVEEFLNIRLLSVSGESCRPVEGPIINTSSG
jgi:hypothetical protein